MKRIVNGVTYNTDTSTMLARYQWEDRNHNDVVTEHGTDLLYQTRGGAFFLHKEKFTTEWDEAEREYRQRQRHEFEPLSPEGANKWLLYGDVEVISNPFDDPPEAAAEAEPGATIYIRVPAALKRRVEEAAGADKVSGNVWAMRCVEQCLAEDQAEDQPVTIRDYKPLACIMEVSSATMSGHDWDEKKLNDALGVIWHYAQELCEDLGIDKVGALTDMADENVGMTHTEVRREFRPYQDSRAKSG